MRFQRLAFLLAVVAGGLAAAGAAAAQQQTSDLFSGFQTNSKDPVHIDADSLDIREDGNQRISVFSGGVVVKRGPTTMKAKTIKLYSDKQQKTQGSAFSRIEAAGPVYVNSADQTVTGDSAVVDMATQIITLTGNVVLTRGKTDVAKGSVLVVNLKTGAANFKNEPGKRIQIVIQPDEKPAAKGQPAKQ
jgi:lipopolysaccharide export system protein LptA